MRERDGTHTDTRVRSQPLQVDVAYVVAAHSHTTAEGVIEPLKQLQSRPRWQPKAHKVSTCFHHSQRMPLMHESGGRASEQSHESKDTNLDHSRLSAPRLAYER